MKVINKVLLATDYSDTSSLALAHAAMLAAHNNAELHVLHVNVEAVPVYGLGGLPLPTEVTPELKQVAEKRLAEFSQPAETPVITAVDWAFAAAPAIKKYAAEQDIDLIVVGTHAHSGVRRFFLGSVSAELVRIAERPVLVVGPDHKLSGSAYRHIVVGVDFSRMSLDALEEAGALAAKKQTVLSAVHVIDSAQLPPYYPYEFAEMDEAKARRSFAKALERMSIPVPVDQVVMTGMPWQKLVEYAAEHATDLMVVGASGLGAVDRWLIGSVTDRVLRSAPCSVLVYRNKGDANS